MYSRMAGTGVFSASSGIQTRAASCVPSARGIQRVSISRIFFGNSVTTVIPAQLPLNVCYILYDAAESAWSKDIAGSIIAQEGRSNSIRSTDHQLYNV